MADFWWNQKPLTDAVETWRAQRLLVASVHLQKAIQDRIDIQGVPTSRRSLPGEAPRMETQDLYKSWVYTVNAPAGYAVVYSPLDYSFYLEVGTQGTFGYIDPRPYIVRTLLAEEKSLVQLLTRNIG